jgi:uncharacterized membrane protein
MTRWTDEQVDRMIGQLLRAGVLVSAAVLLVGGTIYLMRHAGETADRKTFRGEPTELSRPAGIVRAALSGSDRGIIALGLLLLIATPIARVALAGYAFSRQRDLLYVAVASFVLVVLLISVAIP